MTTYTTAPEAYDGFGTRTVAILGTLDRHPFRQVTTPKRHAPWQRSRYQSGGYVAANDAEKDRILQAPWFQAATPQA